jgi:hypothetical protein
MRSPKVSLTASQAGPNYTDRLDRASKVLSARIPRKKPQAKKSPSVLSIETAYEPTPRRSGPKDQTSTEPFSRSNSDQSYQKTQCNDQPQQKCTLPPGFRSIAIKTLYCKQLSWFCDQGIFSSSAQFRGP